MSPASAGITTCKVDDAVTRELMVVVGAVVAAGIPFASEEAFSSSWPARIPSTSRRISPPAAGRATSST